MAPDKNVIDRIVNYEWDMFQLVNAGGPRASCQEDRPTFEGMRRGQFEAWSQEAVDSYLEDLEAANKTGRNLIAEKYIHMMKSTSPRQYDQLVERVTLPTDGAMALVNEISDKMLEQTEVLHKDYPYVSGSGRPLYSTMDWQGTTSIETYQKSELMTYSQKTLELLKKHLFALDAEGRSLSRDILENSTKVYGYDTLDAAEAGMKEYIDKYGIQISFGCSSCQD